MTAFLLAPFPATLTRIASNRKVTFFASNGRTPALEENLSASLARKGQQHQGGAHPPPRHRNASLATPRTIPSYQLAAGGCPPHSVIRETSPQPSTAIRFANGR